MRLPAKLTLWRCSIRLLHYPNPAGHRNDRLQRSLSTHTTTQYFYADVSPRLERILGSTNMQPSTKLFIDGDYRFPVEGDSTPGCIEVRDVTFNMTNRSAQGGAPTDGTRASGGTARNRRNVALKSSPAKPKHTGASSRAGLASAVPAEDVGLQATSSPHTTAADGSEAEMSFSLAEFGNVRKHPGVRGGPVRWPRKGRWFVDIFCSSRKRRIKCKFYSLMFATQGLSRHRVLE